MGALPAAPLCGRVSEPVRRAVSPGTPRSHLRPPALIIRVCTTSRHGATDAEPRCHTHSTRPGQARRPSLDGQTLALRSMTGPAVPTFGHLLDGTCHLPTPQPGVCLSVLPGSGGPWVPSLASWRWGKRLTPCATHTIAPRRADPPMELPAGGCLRSGVAQPWLGASSAAAPWCPLERMAGRYVLLSPRVHRLPTAPLHVPTLGAPV